MVTAALYVWVVLEYTDDSDLDVGLWFRVTLFVIIAILVLSVASAPPHRHTLWGLALGLVVGMVACVTIALAALAEYGG